MRGSDTCVHLLIAEGDEGGLRCLRTTVQHRGAFVVRGTDWTLTAGVESNRSAPLSLSVSTAAPNRTVPHRTAPHRTVPYRTVPYRAVPCRTVPYRAVPHRAVPCHTVPYRTVSCHALPGRTRPY